MKYVPLIGRILLSLIFVMSGFNHIFNWSEMSQYAAMKGVPMPNVAVIITGIMILLGGLSVALGYKSKIGALLLVIFLIPTTLMMHNFWAIEDAMQSKIEMTMFLKNLGLMGGALLVYYFGSGPYRLEKQEG